MNSLRAIAIFWLALGALVCSAQPHPPSITFSLAADKARPQPFLRNHRVEGHCRYRDDYNYELGKAGTWERRELSGRPLFTDTTTGWISYHLGDSWCATSYLLVIVDADTMRLEFVDSLAAHWRLMQRAWKRWDRESPEVIRFRKGTYAFEEVIADPWAVETANAFAKRLMAEEDAAYRKQLADQEEYYRNLPPPAPPIEPYVPPPPMTPEQWQLELAKQPGLKKVELDRVSADTVWVRITGRVRLDGGCASGMPLFGVEMLTDTGWVERLPNELSQMDCGMPWGDWNQRIVMLPPLRWWVGAHQPEGKKELVPGSYRLSFVGGNGRQLWTDPFSIPGP
ncbi:MAG: hypothetical protein IPG92_13675 [Flavobacteriales bacterium]|nr:hypothetical protein [Flavobacteriales bacterium]